MSRQETWRRPLTLSVAAALCVLAACSQPNPQQQAAQGPRPTPAPGVAIAADAAGKQALLTYGHSLEFDTSVIATDEQYMILPGAVIGPWLSVQPEIGSAAISHADLVQGRIVGRATLRGTRGTVVAYAYVDSGTTGWRGLWAVDDARFSLITDVMLYHQHGAFVRGTSPRGRIVMTLKMDTTKTCMECPDGWCRFSAFSARLADVIAAAGPGPVDPGPLKGRQATPAMRARPRG